MAKPLELRPRFYQGQYLDPRDLDAVVEYGRAQEARHALGGHTWGIAAGLTLKESAVPDGSVQVHLMPGYAWDGYGRPLVVMAPTRLPEELFAAQVYDSVIDAGGEGRLNAVWIRVDERHVQPPRAGFAVCDVDDQNARVREAIVFEIGAMSTPHDGVVVASREVDATQALRGLDPAAPLVPDESIPHQAFPAEEDKKRWRLFVGYVRWLPTIGGGGAFAPRKAPDDETAARRLRRYAGVVAESVLAADGVLRLARRGDATSTYFSPPVEETVWISGKTRAEDDVRLAGAALEWRDAAGQDRGTPLLIRRTGDAGKTDADLGDRALEIVIGPDDQVDNRLSVGTRKADGTLDTKAVVMSSGNVGIGTRTPSAKLEVFDGDVVLRAKADDAGDLIFQKSDGTEKGRVWSKTTSGKGLNLSSGGTTPHVAIDADGKVGIGTTSPTNRLHVADATGVRQNYLYVTGDKGWSSLAYNAHHDTANGNWVFPDPSRKSMTIELDDHDNAARLEVYSNAGAGSWLSRFKIDGDSGNVGVAQQSPAVRLHVSGDRIRLQNGDKKIDLRTDGGAVDLQSETHDLYLRSSGPGGKNRLLLNPMAVDGFVGVGLEAPLCKLHVAGSMAADAGDPASHIALIDNTSFGASADVLALRVAASSISIDGSNNFITFFAGATAIGAIEGQSGFLGPGIVFTSGSADFAESVPRLNEDEAIEPGDVVGIVGGRVTRATAGAHHVAVVSTAPVIVGNAAPPDRRHLHEKIAFLGQVPVKVRGPVTAGMFLCASGDGDGTAVAVDEARLDPASATRVVARAWQTDAGKGVRRVHAVVGFGVAEAALGAVVRAQAAALAALMGEREPSPVAKGSSGGKSGPKAGGTKKETKT
jgi:hypothetical protein